MSGERRHTRKAAAAIPRPIASVDAMLSNGFDQLQKVSLA